MTTQQVWLVKKLFLLTYTCLASIDLNLKKIMFPLFTQQNECTSAPEPRLDLMTTTLPGVTRSSRLHRNIRNPAINKQAGQYTIDYKTAGARYP